MMLAGGERKGDANERDERSEVDCESVAEQQAG
jgi:hypothetical protein